MSKPRLLYLAYSFPPARSSACVRTWNTAKYLARSGWEVTVVTPDPALLLDLDEPETVTARLQALGVKRLLTGHRLAALAPFEVRCTLPKLAARGVRWLATRVLNLERTAGWFYSARAACARLSPEDVDAIYATGDPFLAMVLARELGTRLGRPYAVDYRDLWHGNPHPYRRETRRSLGAESRVLEQAAAVTIISWAYAEFLESRFACRGKVEVLPNGYDPDELGPVVGTAFPEPALVYTGAFYPPKRVIDPVLRAFRLALEGGAATRAQFHYYGGQGAMFLEAAEKAGVAAHAVDHGHCSRATALAATKGARLGVVIADVTDEDSLSTNGILTGKVFDVIGLRIPALVVCGPQSDLHRMLEHPSWGACHSGSDLSGMAAYIGEALAGRLPVPRGSETYSWSESVKRLDTLLRRVAGERRHG